MPAQNSINSSTVDTAKSTQLAARKQPSQERSRIKVEQILTAAQEILIENGLEKLTTNLIARRAGMSVGSLYQYFPNKLAIIVELFNRWLNSAISDLLEVAELPKQHPELSIEDVIWQMIDSYYSEPCDNNDQIKYESELIKAVDLYVELHTLDKKHSQRIAIIFSDIMQQLGACLSEQELLDLGSYLYNIQSSIEIVLIKNPIKYQQMIEWHKKSIYSIIMDNCFNNN